MKMLADMMLAVNPRAVPFTSNKVIDITRLVGVMRKAERYVLDENLIRTIVQLSQCYPARAKQYMDLAWPAADSVWIEFPSQPMLQERRAIHGKDFAYVHRQPEARTGILVHMINGAMHLNCFEHDETCRSIFPWPMGFYLFKEPVEQELFECAAVWGYTEGMDLEVLRGYAVPSLHPDAVRNLPKDYKELVQIMTAELAGLVRLTVIALALLASPATRVGPPVRPRGRFIAHNATHPYQPRRFVELEIPKRVREVRPYIEKMLATHHKRLHEVRAHYRHLTYQPRAPGWLPIETPQGMLWRKAIARHLRGDPDLGVVEHEGIHAKGAKL